MIEWLSKPTVSISTLKSIYVAVAQKTPLIIFTEAMRFSIIDRRYLLNLKTDTWDARITYIIAAGVSEKDIQFIQSVTDEKESGTWVFPLLPDIIKPAGTTVNSLAEISLVDIGQSSHYDKFIEKILSGNIYCKMYDLVQSLISRGFEPQHIFFLADQEISLHHYAYLCKVINVLYHKDSHLDQHFILSHEGKLLWLDALSYYITLHDGMDKAVAATQLFFFDIFNNIQNFIYEKPERNKLVVFLKKSANKVSNPLADGFSLYFSDMAALVYHSATNDKFSRCTYEQSFAIVDILDKAGIQFSESSIQALTSLHTYTQLCFILDIGLEAISSYFKSIGSRKDIPCSTVNTISTFQTLCMEEAYKWNDVTLLKKIVELQLNIIASGNCIKIKFNQLTGNEEKDFLYQTLLGILKTKKLEVKDIIMRNTFFLSYAHKDKQIADCVDKLLLEKAYIVKRDERDIKTWGSLTKFMKSIREQDYVVLLISDTYLHRDNCVYEIYQLLKDSDYIKRTFPIAIMLTDEEKQEKEKKQESTSMFDTMYWPEILAYWIQRAKILASKLDTLPRELVGELDIKYRELKKMTDSLNTLFNDSFNDKLLGTISYTNIKKDAEEIVDSIDKNVSRDKNI